MGQLRHPAGLVLMDCSPGQWPRLSHKQTALNSALGVPAVKQSLR